MRFYFIIFLTTINISISTFIGYSLARYSKETLYLKVTDKELTIQCDGIVKKTKEEACGEWKKSGGDNVFLFTCGEKEIAAYLDMENYCK